MLRICQVMPASLNMPLKKFLYVDSIYSLGGIILNGKQGKIRVLINYLYICFLLLYMVTYVAVNSVNSLYTTDVTSICICIDFSTSWTVLDLWK
jgi:hypothetical protein